MPSWKMNVPALLISKVTICMWSGIRSRLIVGCPFLNCRSIFTAWKTSQMPSPITSYYQERWGFCIAHRERVQLREGQYRVFIDSDLKDGYLTYGECVVPGREDREVFLSPYICHPSMANNELSGPVIASLIAKWLCPAPPVHLPDHIYSGDYRGNYVPQQASFSPERASSGGLQPVLYRR